MVYGRVPHGLSLPRPTPLVKSRVTGSFILPGTGRVSDRIPAYEPGRVCEARGCTTILSTYNPSHFCSVHDRVPTR
jgi:hypothetical protein